MLIFMCGRDEHVAYQWCLGKTFKEVHLKIIFGVKLLLPTTSVLAKNKKKNTNSYLMTQSDSHGNRFLSTQLWIFISVFPV